MKQVILIHGLPSKEEVIVNDAMPSPSNAHWFPWIQKQLAKDDLLSQSLEMPHSYNPSYTDHSEVLGQMKISSETILVGHSCGGGFLVRYFSEHKELSPKKIILVAPWLDPEGYLKELDPETTFFNFEIDGDIANRTEVHCIYSTDDEKDILESIERIQEKIPNMVIHRFTDKGHFIDSSLGGNEFPELLELLK